jgi:hypothetical protein
MTEDDCKIMVNPRYMTYLLEGEPSRLAQCPMTTDAVVATGDITVTPESNEVSVTTEPPTGRRMHTKVARYLRENKELIVAVLSVLGAILAVYLTLRTR